MAGNSKLLGASRAPLVVSAIGLNTPVGRGARVLEEALADGRTALGSLEPIATRSFQNRVGGRISFSSDSMGSGSPGRIDRITLEALEDLRVDLDDRGGATSIRTGWAFGTALGDAERVEASKDDSESTFAALSNRVVDACPFSIEGPRHLFSATCVSSLCALEQAAADLAFGRCDAAIVGSADTLSRSMQAGFSALRALSPSGDLRPFDVAHDGIVLGEAAAFAWIEPFTDARRAGRRPLSAVLGHRLRSDAFHLTSPDPEGHAMADAIRGALDDACCAPQDIGCVVVTAAGSAIYDRMLSRAVCAAFGEEVGRRVPVTTWESPVGHLLAATGATAIVFGASILDRGTIPRVFGVDEIDPECELAYVIDEPVPLRSPVVVSLVVGFGGQNGVVVQASPSFAADRIGGVEA